MPVRVQGPDGSVVEFPDGTPKDTMRSAMQKKYGAPQSSPTPQSVTGYSMGPSRPTSVAERAAAQPHHEAPLDQRVSKVMEAAAPSVAATVGSMVGPEGTAIAGATVGGILGAKAQGRSDRSAVGEGALQGATEGVAGMVSKGLSNLAAKASPRATEILNRYIGLTASKMPKFGRTVANAKAIAQTVLDKVGVKPTLEAQHAAIEATRKTYEDATQKIVAAPGGKVADVHSMLYNRAVKLLDDAEKEGVPKEQLTAIDKNLEGLLDASKKGGLMNPQEMRSMRLEIQKQITDWNPKTTNIRQRFLQGAYHDLNDSIARALPPGAQKEFLKNNKIQSQLIQARESAAAKLLKQELKGAPGIATRAARIVGSAAVGGVVGAGVGAESGHAKEGGLAGAALGIAGQSAMSKVAKTELPALDIAAQRAIAKVAPKLSTAAKSIPVIARTLETINSIRSQPQN